MMPPLTDNPTALDIAIRDVTRHGHDLPDGCDLVRMPSGAVVFWHTAEQMESGRILPEEVERVVVRGGYRVTCAHVARLVEERASLTSLQMLTYAQLTGPHVTGG
jgi:hypothetical protein